MKVICIDDAIVTDSDKLPPLKVGKIYTVIKETTHLNMEFYMFSELSVIGYNCWYIKNNFIPLSTIDETELLKERESNLQTI